MKQAVLRKYRNSHPQDEEKWVDLNCYMNCCEKQRPPNHRLRTEDCAYWDPIDMCTCKMKHHKIVYIYQ